MGYSWNPATGSRRSTGSVLPALGLQNLTPTPGMNSSGSPFAADRFNRVASGVRNTVNNARAITAAGQSGQSGQQGQDPYGSQSGPGIMEQWFNQRANGTDPAFEYAMKRGQNQLDNQYAAAGSFNSGAAMQGNSDLYANLISQRMGQLDQLAGGASGEHQNRLNSMFNQGSQIAGGASGLASAYDLGAAGNMQAATNAQQQMNLNKAGVDSQARQSLINNGLSFYGIAKSGGGGNPNSNPYAYQTVDGGAGNPYPQYQY